VKILDKTVQPETALAVLIAVPMATVPYVPKVLPLHNASVITSLFYCWVHHQCSSLVDAHLAHDPCAHHKVIELVVTDPTVLEIDPTRLH
jgi:hypothetical protein